MSKTLTANCSDGRFSACLAVTLSSYTKEGLNMLFPLHNSSPFHSNLMPGQTFFWLYVCTKKYRKRLELTVKGKPNDRRKYNIGFFIFNSEFRIVSERLTTIDCKNTKLSAVSDFYESRGRSCMMLYPKEEINHVLGKHERCT